MLRVIRTTRHVGVFLLMLVGISASPAPGQTTAFTYQGQLTDAGALADSSYDLRFALFDGAAGGAQIGANQTVSAVPVSDGVFTVQLDFGVNAFPGANRFVEIAVRPAGVGSFTTLAPRQQISSSPYAIRTLSAATADALSSACVGCVTNAQIQEVAGSKVSGAIPAASLPTGSGNYIQNGNTPQANANFNIAGNGVVGGNLTVAGTLNANVSGNFIQNRTTPQTGANFNVSGNGTVGSVLSAGSIGIGTAVPAAGVLLDVNGITRLEPGGTGGFMQFSTPNFETGLSFLGAVNRADLRFNDSTVKLVVGPTGGPPGGDRGVAINSAGSVGIGIASPTAGRLHVVAAADVPGIYAESPNRAIWGHSTAASRGVYGDSVSGEGVHGESISGTGVAGITGGVLGINSPGVFGASSAGNGVGIRGDGTTGVYGRSASTNGIGVTGESVSVSGAGVYGTSPSGPGVWGSTTNPNGVAVQATNVSGGAAISAQGHAIQTLEHGGWVKVMLFVNADGTILRCYNSQAIGAAVYTPPCGFQAVAFVGWYQVFADAGFPLNNRFMSVTTFPSGTARTGANLAFESGPGAREEIVRVELFPIDDPTDTIKAPFMLFIF